MNKTYFCTFGSGQPGYPGYLEVTVPHNPDDPTEGEIAARMRMNEATGGKWCGIYDSLDKMHFADKVYRGKA